MQIVPYYSCGNVGNALADFVKDADTAEAAEQMKQFMQGRATSGGGLDKQMELAWE